VGRKRVNPPPAEGLAVCHRIDWVLRTDYSNKLTVMAQAIGVPKAVLSRVVNGQAPSAQLLEGIARLGTVSAHWLLTGEGDARNQPAVGAAFVPLARDLLGGPPDVHRELVGPLGFPAASPLRLVAPYWYRISEGSPATRREGEPTQAGDYLLIETDPAGTRSARLLAGKLIVLHNPASANALLARVAKDRDYFEPDQFDLLVFDDPPRTQILVDCQREGTPAQPSRKKGGNTEIKNYLDDVVGVVLQRLAFEGPH